MSSFRMDQIDKLIKREVSLALNQIKDKYLGFITVVKVETSKDFSTSKIWISSFEEKDDKEIIRILGHYRGDIYSQIKPRLAIKRIPFLIFKIDKTVNRAARVEEILSKLEQNPVHKDPAEYTDLS